MSIFSLTTEAVALNLFTPFDLIRYGYRFIFHSVFDVVLLGPLSWLDLPTIEVPLIVKDITTIYFLVGASLARAFAAAVALRIGQSDKKLISNTGLAAMMVIRSFENSRYLPFRQQIFGLVVATAWPLFLIDLLRGVMLVVKKSKNYDGPSDYYYKLRRVSPARK